MEAEKTLYGISETAARWGISSFSVRRLINRGDLKSICIGGRRLVPLSEIRRGEQFGVGVSRKERRGELSADGM